LKQGFDKRPIKMIHFFVHLSNEA